MARVQLGAQGLHTIQNLPDKIVGHPVVDHVAIPAACQDGTVSYNPQLLGGRRLGKARVGLNMGDPLLPQGQVLNNSKPYGVSQGLQDRAHVGQEMEINGQGR